MRKFVASLFLVFIFIFHSTYADAPCTCNHWKNVYLCPCTKCISKLIFIKNTIYAFTANEGLFKSTDEGNIWTTLRTGLPTREIEMVSLIGDNDNNLLLAVNEPQQHAWYDGKTITKLSIITGVFYQWNAANQQWKKIAAHGIPFNARITCVTKDSQGNLYASFEGGSDSEIVYKSFDHGQNWINLPLPNTQNSFISKTKIIVDSNDNAYLKGIIQSDSSLHSFVYLLPKNQTEWKDTGLVASDIFITSTDSLGLVSEQGDITISQIQLQENGLIKEASSWTYTSPQQNTRPLTALDKNTLYMLIHVANHPYLYRLSDITNPNTKWEMIKNGDENIANIFYLAMHNQHLYAAGSRMNTDQSIDIFQ